SSPMPPAVLAAAVVAAAVSFLVGRASDDAPAATPAPASLQPRVEALEAELARATKVADAARAELARNVAELAEGGTDEAGMKALDTTAADEQAAALQAALDALAAEQKSLHGRIEANYAALRVLGKQVKALEEAAAAK
ncbi:MAG: hypothetical protein O2894_06865, partial [Planctomycetota bacterium]|nr:hypothetical protein [Planctomycetota bacterium]